MANISKFSHFNTAHHAPLEQVDPDIHRLIQNECWRQFSNLDLIASLNLTSRAALEANGSIFTNKFFGGVPGKRYYGGNKNVNTLENLCKKRALEVFGLDSTIWGVNVQPYSGSLANFAAFTALIAPQDKILSLAMSDGGHRTHGYQTTTKKMSATSIYFQTLSYFLDPSTQLIDYSNLRSLARTHQPQLIICGACNYTRDYDWKQLREICDEIGAWLVGDIAHTCGLVIAGELTSPFDHCDVVTTTTHKTLRGPRAGLIFFSRAKKGAEDLESRINNAVYPGCQGSPHDNTIAAITTSLYLAAQPAFKAYAKQVIANAKILASELLKHGYTLQTGGTDNHMILWDLRPTGLSGSELETLCELVGMIVNKYPVSGDAPASVPRGIRVGTATLTSRSVPEEQFKVVASFLHRAVQLSLALQNEALSRSLEEFYTLATTGQGETAMAVGQLRKDVRAFAKGFPVPGVDINTLEKPEGSEED